MEFLSLSLITILGIMIGWILDVHFKINSPILYYCLGYLIAFITCLILSNN